MPTLPSPTYSTEDLIELSILLQNEDRDKFRELLASFSYIRKIRFTRQYEYVVNYYIHVTEEELVVLKLALNHRTKYIRL